MAELKGRITAIDDLTDRIRQFTITAPEGSLPGYDAGAHIRINLADGQERAYSLICFTPPAAKPDSYTIAVQREDDGQGGSRQMHALAPGDTLRFAPPKNDFALVPDAQAVLLAGGIGITPMISMAATLKAANQPFDFHYTGRSAGVMAYCAPLRDTFGKDLHLHCDDVDSALDLDAVIASVGGRHLYVCGPRGLIDAARDKAEAAGIAADHIHFELFENAAPQAGDVSFEVEVSSTGAVFMVGPDQSIIDALEEGGVDVMYDCQRGDCGICQCDVIEGVPDHRDVVLSQAERDSGKVMQICVSRAKTARLVLDI